MLTLNINGKDQALDVPADMPLLWVLRDVAHLTGTKFGCGMSAGTSSAWSLPLMLRVSIANVLRFTVF